jgi:16S rRNA (adenine1518-N6/adenine1519-N6)-dimethyltransferase
MTEPKGAPSPASLLHGRGLGPRKRLGQNFLRDRSFLPRIVAALDLQPDDQVVEIGAGTGVLTGALLGAGTRVIAIELDDALFALLTDELGADPRLRLWHGNVLDFDPCEQVDGPYKLVGNIPYYITGPIVRKFLESPCRPGLLVFMVQREVAERMVARPGDLSLLGVSVQYYADARIVMRVPAGAFYPPPKVDSAVVALVPRGSAPGSDEAGTFFEVARAGFSVRRKQLANALANGLRRPRADVQRALSSAGIEGSRRAEELTLDEWRRLARAWEDVR